MDRDLENALQRIGWDTLYERHIEGLRNENVRGERTARSPFPFSNDGHASFSVNVRSGLWQCWHSRQLTGISGGNYVQFVALMRATNGNDGRPVADFSAAERDLRVEVGLARPVDTEWLTRCQMALAHADSPGHTAWHNRKPWFPQTLVNMGIGWDQTTRRFVIPMYDQRGMLTNCRMYSTTAEVKMLWSTVGMSGNFLFPFSARTEPWIILVEGEPDAISLRCYGYNAASGTMGSGNPVPEGRWWVGKQVFVWMDIDGPGQEAEERATRLLRDGATEVRIVRMPEWEGRPDNADPSDMIMHLLRLGYQPEQIQREITKCLQESLTIDTVGSEYDAAPRPVEFHEAMSAVNTGTKIAFNTHVLGKSSKVYGLATDVNITCPSTGHTWCRTCPMNVQWHGDANIRFDPRARMSLKLIQSDDDKRDVSIKEHVRIPLRCPEPRITVVRSTDVQLMMFGTTLIESEVTNPTTVDRRRHEAMVLNTDDTNIIENTDYTAEGFVYTMPKNQQQVFMIEKMKPCERPFDKFEITAENLELLKRFIPISDVSGSICEVATDLERGYTCIRGRADLHMMFRSVFHSVLAFNFAGSIYKRGWLEALVVGDTRCGKSATFRKMAELYGTGILVDCKMQTPAGMLGAVETSITTGERFVLAGLYPQQDGAGPVCMDEFSNTRWGASNIMDHMSSTRAEGKVIITKAAHATFMARVRLIMMGNPGVGRLMRDIGGYGVEMIPKLIYQPEDIARFDMAMTVSQDDVPFEIINVAYEPQKPRWSKEAHRALLAWTWSRKPHQVVWDVGAEQAVLQFAAMMVMKYDADIPIVEPSDQRMRIAKLAVSVAAQCFSTDETNELIVVKSEHVYTAASMFQMWYDKKTFGYDAYSQRARIERTLLNEQDIEALLDRILAANPIILAEKLVRLVEFNERVFGTVIPMNFTELHSTMQMLSINRCIRQCKNSRRGDNYELTPGFVNFLRTYIQKRKG